MKEKRIMYKKVITLCLMIIMLMLSLQNIVFADSKLSSSDDSLTANPSTTYGDYEGELESADIAVETADIATEPADAAVASAVGSARAGYNVYRCRRMVTIHGTVSNPVYFYRGAEHTSITDTEWDKYTFEATIFVDGYTYSSSTGYRYFADIECGGGASKGQIITYYIPFNANITLASTLHSYGSAESAHPHRAYCDCGVSKTAENTSCFSCCPSYIYYYANGGSGAPDTQKVTSSSVKLSSVIPTRFKYRFDGWSTSSTAQSGEYRPERTVSISANSTLSLYATWEECQTLSGNQDSGWAYIRFGGTEAYFEFTPLESGTYVLQSESGSYPICISLYNSNGTKLASDNDSGEKYQTEISYNLTGGTTYYYGVKWYGTGVTGDIKVTLEAEEPEIHVHSYGEWIVTKEATVDSTGLKERSCSECGEKEQQTIPKLNKPAQNNPFTDVKEKDYFYNSVLWAVENNITAGVSPTIFAPNADCTRAQVVTFLWRASGKPEPNINTASFRDVPSNAYYYKAVLWALEKDITSGYNAATFGSEDKVTRAQFVTFLWRMKGKQEPASMNNAFSDISASAYYYKAVLWAVEKGVTAGYYGNMFAPDLSCTRAQVVSFLYRARNIAAVNNTFIESNTIQKYGGTIYTSYPVPENSGMIQLSIPVGSNMIIYDGYVYYANKPNGHLVWLQKMKLDGTERSTCALLVKNDDFYNTPKFCLYGDNLYYTYISDSGEGESRCVGLNETEYKTLDYSYNCGNSKIWLVSKDDTYSYCQPGFRDVVNWPIKYDPFDVYGEYVIYYAKRSIMKVHKNDIGNASKGEVVAGPNVMKPIGIFGDGIYYTKDNDTMLYRTDMKNGNVIAIDIHDELSLDTWELYELHEEIDGKLFATGEYGDGTIVFEAIDITSYTPLTTDYLSDGEYAAAFSASDIVQKNNKTYLTFNYYTYEIYGKAELLNVKVGDTVKYDGQNIVVRDIKIDSWNNNGIQMYSVFINRTDTGDPYEAGYVTDLSNPNLLMEVQFGGDYYPLYKYARTVMLELNPNMKLYDQVNPGAEYTVIPYSEIIEYCSSPNFYAFPERSNITIKDNMITEIVNIWIP